jgi:ferritin
MAHDPTSEADTISRATTRRDEHMQIADTMEQAFNAQVTMELQAAHNYLAMAGWFDAAGFPGCSAWMRIQSEEEHAHALRIYQYILDRGGRVAPGALDAPEADFDSVLTAFEHGLDQERTVSASINRLYALAMKESDFASVPLLDWFVSEQIEEEATFSQIVDDLRLAQDNPQALLLLDRELGARSAGSGASE